MCTVTFLPLKNGVLMTSNRDEHISRGNAVYPEFSCLQGKNLVFPKDQLTGGTWLISNEKGDTGILLNGAFEKHISNPPYRKSRGLILPEIFQNDSPLAAIEHYSFTGIENFTIILWQQNELWEIKWNGKSLCMEQMDQETCHIWSSVTLYTPEMTAERQQWFTEWLKTRSTIDQGSVLNFHTQTEKNNKEYGLQIARPNKIVTVSVTSIMLKNQHATLIHKDMLQGIEVFLDYDISFAAKTPSLVNFYDQHAQDN